MGINAKKGNKIVDHNRPYWAGRIESLSRKNNTNENTIPGLNNASIKNRTLQCKTRVLVQKIV
jgi:hypothetical protein